MRLPPARGTAALVAITALCFGAVALGGRPETVAFSAGFIPARVGGLDMLGAFPVVLTPLSSTLVHGGVLHLGANMLMLAFCGRYVEPAMRARGLLLLYVASAYAAAAAEFLWSPLRVTPTIGASGAISGVFAAYALLYGERRTQAVRHPVLARWLNVAWLAVAWIAISLLLALASAANGFAVAVPSHVGGFIAGLLLTRPLLWLRFGRALGGGRARS